MNKKRILKKELLRREMLALDLYGSKDYHKINKNHERIAYLRKYLNISNQPRRISVVELLLKNQLK